MTNFFALSFDNAASPSLRLKVEQDPDSQANWGVVWYSGDDGLATKVKSSGNGDEEMNRMLADWNRFRSASFFAMSGERQHGKNSPPYLRSYGGRQFVFIFSGALKGDVQTLLPLGGDPSFEPLGSAASEHVFCWLLHKLFENQSRKLSGVSTRDLHRWLGEINALGELNCVISDGLNQVAYRDREGRGGLYGLRRIPPHTHTHLENDALTMDLGDAMDASRSVYLFSTEPLSPEDWQAVPAGAMLCNARGVHDASTAEWVIGATIAALRQFPYFAAEQAAGRWSYRFTDCLAGQKVLIVGHGSIGRAVERRLAGFEVEISRVARTARDGVSPVSQLPDLLPGADVVIVLAPVTAETVGMVDAAFLARMKDGALLVNAARGSLVVTDALTGELQSGRLSAAADVTDPEPLPPGHPWWGLPNVLITPHVAASTSGQEVRMLTFLRAQAERYIRGEDLVNAVIGPY